MRKSFQNESLKHCGTDFRTDFQVTFRFSERTNCMRYGSHPQQVCLLGDLELVPLFCWSLERLWSVVTTGKPFLPLFIHEKLSFVYRTQEHLKQLLMTNRKIFFRSMKYSLRLFFSFTTPNSVSPARVTTLILHIHFIFQPLLFFFHFCHKA